MSTSSEAQAGCHIERQGSDCAVVHLSGELDAATVPCLDQQIAAHLAGGSESVVLDLTDVQFLDSTGIRLLIQVLMREGKDRVTVVLPRGANARRPLEIVGIGRVVHVAETLVQALPEERQRSQAA
jgi:anti-anti-sigma factor